MTSYNYAGGDPINANDPSGLCIEDSSGNGGDGGCVPQFSAQDAARSAGLVSACFVGAALVGSYTAVLGPAGLYLGNLVGCFAGFASAFALRYNLIANHLGKG